MPKTFYTERDIEDLARRGIISLVVDDDVVLTDLAREKAMRLGIELVQEHDLPPSAPERPYITRLTSPSASQRASRPEGATNAPMNPPGQPPAAGRAAGGDDLYENVRAAVVARLGDAVDANLLDRIIRRVLQNVAGGQG